ncbi:MAG: glutamine-hydrolyzing carbamoyl-phosphate synthase small subunit [Oscillospiraceae bacterium]|nr:glutamine-hydrolyzing carbamoyl-phosphate synthase small subunit [Oscillospiraceae bacterium]
MEKAYLVLGNGQVYEGQRIGANRDSTGELVFTTGMVGYLETLTDPSYAGQIILQTFPLIGNYGVISPDFEGDCHARGYVVRELCDAPSNFRSEYELDRFLKERGIPGICGVDTRAITRLLREEGVMNARICSQVPADLAEIRSYQVRGVVAQASSKEIAEYPAQGEERFQVVLIDYGAKRNIIRCLQKRGCRVKSVPHDTSAEAILSMAPDGVMLSNGPGDPEENVYEIRQIRKLMGKVPIFGICLGHQLTALAMGGKTVKLKYGHRGANQPVRLFDGPRTYISSQNHGYAVVSESMEGIAKLSYVNANDLSCEGLDYPDQSCFTVQFHPEACGGPHDTEFLFDRFIAMMGGDGHA